LPKDLKFLVVSVIGASGLLAVDKNGKSDPFVILRIGKIAKKTKVIPKSLDPAWNEAFLFPLTGEWQKEDLKFSVFDHNLIEKNNILGGFDFSFKPFADLPFDDPKLHTIDLQGEGAKGSLTFVFSIHKDKPKRESFNLHDKFHKKIEIPGIEVDDDIDVEGKRGKLGLSRPHLPDVDIHLPKFKSPKFGLRGKKEIGEMDVEFDEGKQVWTARQVLMFESTVSVIEQDKKTLKLNLEYANGLQQKLNKVVVWIETSGKETKSSSKKEFKLDAEEGTTTIKYDHGQKLEPSSDKVSHKLYLEFRFASSFATVLCGEHLHIK